MKKYLYNLLIAFDQLINSILGGFCDETLSSRMGKHVEKKDGWLSIIICKMLNLIDKNHCKDAIEEDEEWPK